MIIFDFDNTLFNTSLLKEDLRQVVMDLVGIDEDYFWRSLRESYGFFPHLPGVYTIEGHYRTLGEKGTVSFDDFRSAIHTMALERGTAYLYPDVVPALERLAKSHELTLVTKGEESFQNVKLDAVGIRHYFSSIHIVPDGKHEVLRQLVGDQSVININDRLDEVYHVKEHFPQVQCVVVNRDGRHDAVVCEFPIVTDITKVL